MTSAAGSARTLAACLHGTLIATCFSDADGMMNTSLRAGLLGLCISLPLIASEAQACLNAVELSRKEAVKLINDAEAALAAGDAAGALSLIDGKLAGEEGYEVSNDKLDKRIQRVWAVARLRAGDSADVDAAVTVLREQSDAAPKDPWLKVRLAEALSRTKKGGGEARQLLEDLAKRDLIVDPEGFATLARLRKSAKDDAGATQALDRCKAMAKNPAVCSDAPLSDPKKVKRRAATSMHNSMLDPGL